MRFDFLFWVFAGLAGVSHGAPVYPTTAETVELLKSGQFAMLDRRYGEIQAAYRDGAISDVDLRAAFRTFYGTDPALEKPFEAWVKHSPKSYPAHLARGIYYKFLGSERRGTQFSRDTSDAQFEAMHAAHRIAAKELEASRSLEAKPLLTYLHSIDLASKDGDARDLLDRAIAIDPDTFVVREKYMSSLQTAWGGSVEEMQQFLEESRSARLTDEQMKSLEALVLADEAWVKRYLENDERGALAKYREAAALDQDRSCDACGPLMRAAEIAQNLRDYPAVIELYSKVLEKNPDIVHALNGRAFAHLRLINGPLAAADYLKAAQLGDAYAQMELARMLMEGAFIPADREAALPWLEKAAAQGHPAAQVMLAEERKARP